MKKYVLPALFAAFLALFTALPTQAEQLNAVETTCADFVNFSEENQAISLGMIAGMYLYELKPEVLILDFDRLDVHVDRFVEYCKKNPGENFYNKAVTGFQKHLEKKQKEMQEAKK